MKSRILAFLILFCFAVLPLEAKKKDKKSGKSTIAMELSYALGTEIGSLMFRTQDAVPAGDFVLEAFLEGVNDFLDDSGKMTQEESHEILMNYFTVVLPARTLEESEAWLQKMERETPGIRKSETGLLYVVDNPGDTGNAARHSYDVGLYAYTIWTMHGKEVVTSESTEFSMGEVIKGFEETMPMIGPGGSLRMWLHPDLAFGKYGRLKGGVQPYEAVYIEVTCLEVQRNDPEDSDDDFGEDGEDSGYEIEFSDIG